MITTSVPIPGADGIPVRTADQACVPDPRRRRVPFHDRYDLNIGARRSHGMRRREIDGGKMDGFVREEEKQESLHDTISLLQTKFRSLASLLP